MQIETLKEFVTLAQTLNFREASEKLFISQPTLTRHIKELEEQLGVRLFDRDTQTVSVTHDGARVLEWARLMCDLSDGMLRELGKESTHALTVGVPVKYRFYSDLIHLAIERMSADHPHFRCKVIDVGVAPDPAAFLQKGCDVVLVYDPEKYSGGDLKSVPLCDKHLSLWVSTANPLAERVSVSVGELDGMIFRPCTSDTRYIWHEIVHGIFHTCGITPVVGEEADAFYQLGPRDFALMFGGAPDPSFGFGVRQIPLDEEFVETVCATYRRSCNSAAVQLFVDALKQAARELGGE
ncbi:MAG: LysR family transcriptional regulator [Coriobacteriia bacterium]